MIISNPRGELDPLQTVGQQIGNILRYHMRMDRTAIRARVLDFLRQVSIPDPERRLNAYPHELSGGMAQRVVMAIALACSPKFIISDDATSGLDVTVQAQVLELMRKLVVERGTSLLFITRDIGITAHFCDRVAVIYAGEIMELAARERVLRKPAAPLHAAAARGLFEQRAAAPLLAGRGRDAQGDGAEPHRLPLRQPLRARAAQVPERASGLARARTPPLRALPFSGGALKPCRS